MIDWTVDPQTGRSNSSELYLALRQEITRLIRDDSYQLLSGHTDKTAGLILAQLVHKYGFAPVEEEFTWKALRGEDEK